MDNLFNDLKAKYEEKYQTILAKYRAAVREAENLKPAPQKEAVNKAREEALAAARALKREFIAEAQAIIKQQEAKIHYEKLTGPVSTIEEKILDRLDLLLVHQTLSTGKRPLIEALFEERKNNPRALKIMAEMLRGQEGYGDLLARIEEAATTDMDRLEQLKIQVRHWEAMRDKLPTAILPHDFQNDFGLTKAAQDHYFGGAGE